MNFSRTHLKPATGTRKGVALVITLIFLSLITFMAVTFLVVSRHGAEQTTTSTTQAIAKMAAEDALQRAAGQISAQMFANTNGFNQPLYVSTNYSPGFDNGLSGNPNPVLNSITNVGYQYGINGVLTGVPLKNAQQLQIMLNNLLILPRPPVFISTNKNSTSNEFRYFVNLNRNRDAFGNDLFDNTGLVPLVVAGVTNVDAKNNVIFTNVVGDPQWVGILDHPDQRHSASNQFVARYAFIALPIGNSLDINYIHNQAKQALNPPANEGFLRDQGVGSWEINLAGFLNALNPNPGFWDYGPYETNNLPSGGAAFLDAAEIVQYRYNGNFNTLRSFLSLYGRPASILFSSDLIDGYTVGPLMSSLPPTGLDPDAGFVRLPWSGADNTNQFFDTQDFFTSVPVPSAGLSFSNRLVLAGSSNDTFNEYTFYRMLSQLSFGSAPDPANKLDLNYVNVGIAATNFIPWTAAQFFTNAADRLLRSRPEFIVPVVTGGSTTFMPLSITNIPVYPVNFYTPAVHRMLQLAANIYDAGVNKTAAAPNDFDYPSVFRPIFTVNIANNTTNVYISGYEEVTNVSQVSTQPIWDLRIPAQAGSIQPRDHVYGIPLVIGAKKGFPNFNEFSMQSTITLTRKVEVDKLFVGNTRSNWLTNIQYTIGISNAVAVEMWNSYRSNYSRAVTIIGSNNLVMVLTNTNSILVATNIPMPMGLAIPQNAWAGFNSNSLNTNLVFQSFRMPLYATTTFLPDSVYHLNGKLTSVNSFPTAPFEATGPAFQPNFGLNITNRMRVMMVDRASGRIIDYVQFNGMDAQRNVNAELQGTTSDPGGHGGVWNTNFTTNLKEIQGVNNQVLVSMGDFNPAPGTGAVNSNDWASAASLGQEGYSSVQTATTTFANFLSTNSTLTNTALQAPYTPTRKISMYCTWQANDPLVHYTLGDLTGTIPGISTLPTNYYWIATSTSNTVLQNIGQPNVRYIPWNGQGNPKRNGIDAIYKSNLGLKDPLISGSDDWQFPTNRYPNIGWLGRVHRGTPWQTIYMKSAAVDTNLTTWQNWVGNSNVDSFIMQPTNDWGIFDLFTTAPNDNASRGQLSINQTNFAAWAAVLSGVIVVNNSTNGYVPWVIDPVTNAPALQAIVAGINAQRASTNPVTTNLNFPGGVFTQLGQILSVSNLTVASPFLNTSNPTVQLNDEAYERLPQQIMSLLRVGQPRYVIFAWGQSLKPANNSILTSGPFIGMCTNYQITGEVLTRTVVRFEPSTQLDPSNPFTAMNQSQNPAFPGQSPAGQRFQFRQLGPPPPPRAVIESFTVMGPE